VSTLICPPGLILMAERERMLLHEDCIGRS
jgi:hypothetical protein